MLYQSDLDLARYEIKFVDRSSSYDYLKNWVLLNPSCFKTPYPARIVNNIYFDNEEYDSYIENLSGATSRTKIRLRWYGESLNPSEANLEIKSKRNRLGFKASQLIQFSKGLSELSHREIVEEIDAQLEGDLSIRFKLHHNPMIMNRYHRDYFVTGDSMIRATIDKDIRFYDQRFSSHLNCQFRSLVPEMTILEIKTPAKEIALAEDVIKSLQLTPSKSSKYVVGIQSILGFQ